MDVDGRTPIRRKGEGWAWVAHGIVGMHAPTPIHHDRPIHPPTWLLYTSIVSVISCVASELATYTAAAIMQ